MDQKKEIFKENEMMKQDWWKKKVAYQIYPKSFQDSNGDGIGDLPGIISRLDYLKELGIDIIWISPIYQSPMVDQGYDISDYQSIDPCFGDMEDMRHLVDEVKKSIYELGTDGRLVQMQLDELIGGLEAEELLIIKDYIAQTNKRKTPEKALQEIRNSSINSGINDVTIAKAIGYENFENYEEIAVYPKGYRILSKVPKIPSNIVDNLVKYFKSFQHILLAEIEELDKVDGIGEVRALNIKQTLKRMQEQFVFDNIMI